MKKPIIKVSHNVWGNFRCMIGNKVVLMTGESFLAQHWLDTTFDPELYKLSKHSYLKVTE